MGLLKGNLRKESTLGKENLLVRLLKGNLRKESTLGKELCDEKI